MMAANVFSSGYNNLFANTSKPSVFTMPATSQNFNVPKTAVPTSTTQWVGSMDGGGAFGYTPKQQLSPPINPAYKIPADFKVEPPGTLTPTGGSTLGANTTVPTGPQTSTGLLDQSTANVNNQIRTSGQNAVDRTSAFYNEQVGKVDASYKPMFDFLDNEIGATQREISSFDDPNVMGSAETRTQNMFNDYQTSLANERGAGINSLEVQRGGVTSQADFQKRQLAGQAEEQKSNIFSNTQKNLNAIDATARANMQGIQRRLGAAANSSSNMVLQEAVARQALKAKGEQLGIRTEQMGELDRALAAGNLTVDQWAGEQQNLITAKQGEVERAHASAMTKLVAWKNETLTNAASEMASYLKSLQSQKVNASVEKANQIAQLEQTAFANIEAVLRDIDAKVAANTQAADQWKIQKMSNLEDLKAQYATATQYATPTAPSYKLEKIETGTYDAQGNPNFIQAWVGSDGSVKQVDMSGYEMTNNTTAEEPKKNLFSFLSDGVGFFK